MYSISVIQEESRRAARRSAQEGLLPVIVEQTDLANIPPFPFPNIGNRRPRGYKFITQHFVDHSGFGAPGEPALTPQEFKDQLVVGHAYAISEVGQFQLYVSEFEVIK